MSNTAALERMEGLQKISLFSKATVLLDYFLLNCFIVQDMASLMIVTFINFPQVVLHYIVVIIDQLAATTCM